MRSYEKAKKYPRRLLGLTLTLVRSTVSIETLSFPSWRLRVPSPFARSKSYEVEALFGAPRSSRDHATGGRHNRQRIARYHLMMPLAPSPDARADRASLTLSRR
jgi:hypothetical protein